MTTETATEPIIMSPPQAPSSSNKEHANEVKGLNVLSEVENKARNLLESFADRSRKTNYISLLIGYTRHAVQPAVHKWASWNGLQRIIAVCILLPLLSAPLMTVAFFTPLIVLLAVVGYIVLFGKDCACHHYNEAVKEHFGAESLTLDTFKKQAEGLRLRAEGSGQSVVQSLLHFASHGISQVLVWVVAALDFLITVLNV